MYIKGARIFQKSRSHLKILTIIRHHRKKFTRPGDLAPGICALLIIYIYIERERERERERDRQTDRQTDRDRKRQTERATYGAAYTG
jgi:hypothetical protein